MNQNFQKSRANHDFIRDFQDILRDGETLFRNAGNEIWNEYVAARQAVGLQVKTPTIHARHGLSSIEESTLLKAEKFVVDSSRYVRQNPWRATAAGLCIGLVIGAMIAERR